MCKGTLCKNLTAGSFSDELKQLLSFQPLKQDLTAVVRGKGHVCSAVRTLLSLLEGLLLDTQTGVRLYHANQHVL